MRRLLYFLLAITLIVVAPSCKKREKVFDSHSEKGMAASDGFTHRGVVESLGFKSLKAAHCPTEIQYGEQQYTLYSNISIYCDSILEIGLYLPFPAIKIATLKYTREKLDFKSSFVDASKFPAQAADGKYFGLIQDAFLGVYNPQRNPELMGAPRYDADHNLQQLRLALKNYTLDICYISRQEFDGISLPISYLFTFAEPDRNATMTLTLENVKVKK